MTDADFITQLYDGNRQVIARAITTVEKGGAAARELLESIHERTGRAYRIGITGPPGAGKSTLTNQLVKYYRKRGKLVGVVAIDPSSPFTQGAVLGDRVRMSGAEYDEGVFVRSMAERGSLGGLSQATQDAADVMDAAGFDYVFIETVGVGQSELDIAAAADTVMLVLVPESGDSVQAMKAGLMEVADLFVVNKCDRPDSSQAISAIQSMLNLRSHAPESWMPEITKAVASEGTGIEDIADQVSRHQAYLHKTNELQQRRILRSEQRIKQIVSELIIPDIWGKITKKELEATLKQVVAGGRSPYEAALRFIEIYRTPA